MKAREIMTPLPEVVLPDEPVSLAARLMDSRDVGLIPVVENRSERRLIGVITDRDIAIRHVARGHLQDCPVRSHMTAVGIDVIRPDDDVHDAMGRMSHDRVRRIPVVDEEHRVVGIISQADVLRRVGPREPVRVEHVLADISEPHDLAERHVALLEI